MKLRGATGRRSLGGLIWEAEIEFPGGSTPVERHNWILDLMERQIQERLAHEGIDVTPTDDIVERALELESSSPDGLDISRSVLYLRALAQLYEARRICGWLGQLSSLEADTAIDLASSLATCQHWATYLKTLADALSADRNFSTGSKIHNRPDKGGPKPKISRDMDMAREYLRRRDASHLSDTALKAAVGKQNGLAKSASIEAINRGLKRLSKKQKSSG